MLNRGALKEEQVSNGQISVKILLSCLFSRLEMSSNYQGENTASQNDGLVEACGKLMLVFPSFALCSMVAGALD